MTVVQPDNRFQEEFGLPGEGVRTKVRDFMEEPVRDFIRHSPFAVLATSDAEGHCDASPRGGTPGFVRVLDERRLLLPDVAGNRMRWNLLANAEIVVEVGRAQLLGMDFPHRWRW